VESVLDYSPVYLFENPFVWHDSIHPEDLEEVDKVIKEFSEGKSFDIEYRIKDADGNWHWLRDRSIGRHKTEEEIIIEGIATDITDQKRADEMLRGILPLCSFCKKIRDDKGYWEQAEVFCKDWNEA